MPHTTDKDLVTKLSGRLDATIRDLVHMTSVLASTLREQLIEQENKVLRLRAFSEPIPYSLHDQSTRAEQQDAAELHLIRLRRYHVSALKLHAILNTMFREDVARFADDMESLCGSLTGEKDSA